MARRRPRPSQGSAAGSRGQVPSLRPPRMTRSADCTRASSVPQMAMPGWVLTAGSGTSRAAICDSRRARYSSAAEGGGSVGLGGEGVEKGEGGGAGVLLPEGVRGPPSGPAASASAAARWRATCSARERVASGRGGRGRRGARRSRRGRRGRRPSGEVGPVDPGGAAAQAPALEAGGEAEVVAAGAGGAVDQRVLEEDQQVLGGEAGAGKGGEAAEEDAGRGQGQRAAGAVVGDDRPSGRARR